MKELQVVTSDDLIYTQTGERVPADETIVVSLDGKTRELDLTADNAKTLRETITPFLNAGHVPGDTPGVSKRDTAPAPSLVLSRIRKKAIRDWADARGLRSPDGKRPIWRTSSGGYYYPERLMTMYEAWLASSEAGREADLTDYA